MSRRRLVSPGDARQPACQSSLRRNRFRESGQPCSAWNHVRHVLGGTPGTEAAYRGAGQVPLLAGGIAQMLAS